MKSKSVDYVALDIGSSKIAAVAAQIDYAGEVRILSQLVHSSDGVKSSNIIDWKNAERSILNAIYALEKDVLTNIKRADVSLSGSGTKSYYSYSKIQIRDVYVSQQDIQFLIKQALDKFHVDGQEVIHYFPIEFILDDNNGIQDPVGMFGKELGCRLHIITAPASMLLNLSSCLSKCHVEVSSFILSSYASALACLTEDEKELGAILIDIGAKTTSFSIFLDKKVIYTGSVPIGSWHITSDIAKALSLTVQSAEKLKVLYGSAIESSSDKNDVIHLEDLDIDSLGQISVITVEDLVSIIYPRAEEIFLLIKEDYQKLDLDYLISRKVVLTGGGAALRGMRELASIIFNKQVRIATLEPENNSLVYDCNVGIFSTVSGMVENFVAKRKKYYLLNPDSAKKGLIKKIFNWIKEYV